MKWNKKKLFVGTGLSLSMKIYLKTVNAILLVFFACISVQAQMSGGYLYTDATTDGYWATGYSSLTPTYNTYGHSYWVKTKILSPSGRSASSTSPTSSGYFVSTYAYLNISGEDGEYEDESEGWFYCYVGHVSILLGAGQDQSIQDPSISVKSIGFAPADNIPAGESTAASVVVEKSTSVSGNVTIDFRQSDQSAPPPSWSCTGCGYKYESASANSTVLNFTGTTITVAGENASDGWIKMKADLVAYPSTACVPVRNGGPCVNRQVQASTTMVESGKLNMKKKT